MTFRVEFHILAERELNEAAGFFESEVAGLGLAFLGEVEHAIASIQEHPEACPRIMQMVRRKLLRRFPYSIHYSVAGGKIRILSSGVLFYEPIGAYFYEAAWRRREARLSVD
jgi:plasmid stabilization system protein ParE